MTSVETVKSPTKLLEPLHKSPLPQTLSSTSSSVCVIKEIPPKTDNSIIQEIFSTFGEIIGVYIFEAKSYAYIHFHHPESVTKAIETFQKTPLQIMGKEVIVVNNSLSTEPTKKQPLDLNSPSKILLLTFYQIQIPITVSKVLEIFSHFGLINKIIVYQKKNIHALIETDTVDTAKKIKEKMDGKNLKNHFKVKIQFTEKTELIVYPNSANEYDRSFLSFPGAGYSKNLKRENFGTARGLGGALSSENDGELNFCDSSSSSKNQAPPIPYSRANISISSTNHQGLVIPMPSNNQCHHSSASNQTYASDTTATTTKQSLTLNINHHLQQQQHHEKMLHNHQQHHAKIHHHHQQQQPSPPSFMPVNLPNNNNNSLQQQQPHWPLQSQFCKQTSQDRDSDDNKSTEDFVSRRLDDYRSEISSGKSSSGGEVWQNLPEECFLAKQKLFYSEGERYRLDAMKNSDCFPHKRIVGGHHHQIEQVGNGMCHQEEAKEECVNRDTVLVQNLYGTSVTLDMLFNLFSVYGNISMIRFCEISMDSALVQYQDQYQAMIAKMNLHNCHIFGRIISVSLSNISINLLNQLNNPPELYKDFSLFKEQRFKIPGSKNFKNLSQPSKNLHLSNIHPQSDENYLRCLFSSIAVPTKIVFFSNNKSMAVCSFQSIDEAIRILMTFHNFNIDTRQNFQPFSYLISPLPNNRLLKISFLKNNQNQLQNQNPIINLASQQISLLSPYYNFIEKTYYIQNQFLNILKNVGNLGLPCSETP